MMGSFVRLLLMLYGVIGLALLLARLIGNQQPLNVAPLFTNADGTTCQQPCLLGVRPGETNGITAAALLRSHPLTRQFEVISERPFRIEGDAGQIMMISFNEAADGIVDEITLAAFLRYNPDTGSPYSGNVILPPSGVLGDILSQFGSPDFVQLTQGGDPLLVFVDASVSASLRRAQITDRHLSPLAPLSRLTLYRMEKCPASAFDYVFLRWNGMVNFQRYAFADTLTIPIRRINSAGAGFAPCKP